MDWNVRSLSCSSVMVGTLLMGSLASSAQTVTPKIKVTSDTDLPRFSYPVAGTASALLTADDATFQTFLRKPAADLDLLLMQYDIQDKATLRHLLGEKALVAMWRGDIPAALAALAEARPLIEKADSKAMFGLFQYPMLKAWQDTGSRTGPAFEKEYASEFAARLNALPWALVADSIRSEKTNCQIDGPAFVEASVKADLDPAVAETHTVDLLQAMQIISDRYFLKYEIPECAQEIPILTAYLRLHTVAKPDIWAAREVTLSASDTLTPVRIGIWDSGVDTALYPTQLFTDTHPGAHGPHGLAYDEHGKLFAADLQPLTPEQQALYPKYLQWNQGYFDLYDNIDSAAGVATMKWYQTVSADDQTKYFKSADFLDQWTHGTHVAGIAVRGNPAARLVVVQFNDQLIDLPFAPTVAWANQFKSDFLQMADYFNANHVRVVNASWADSVSEFETWLAKTSKESDPAVRKQLAQQVYAVWKDAVESAIRRSPNVLFVCAAGNSNSNASFIGDVPASLHLPNLITVGAVDQAGKETSFTSYGDTVVLDADGYEVESFLPGGTRMKESGTSMASPNVVNLAAKLIALKPSLTPQQTIALMKQAAEQSPDGRLHLINPKATVELLKKTSSVER